MPVVRWFRSTWCDLRRELRASFEELSPAGRWVIRLSLPLLVPIYFFATFVEDLIDGPDRGGFA